MLPAKRTPSLRDALAIAETALVAAAAGIGFMLAGVPAGLVSGSMLAVAVAALLGRPMKVPLPFTRVCFVLVGILLGAVVTPETLRGMATWPLSIAILIASAVCMIVATTCYLRFVHRWDLLSALLGASPGSMAQVIALSAEFGLDMRGIAIVQTTRVLMVTLALPGGLALFGLMMGADAGLIAAPARPESSVLELAILVTVSAFMALAMVWLRFPGGLLFGAMAGSAILHGAGFVSTVLPWWLGSASVVALGAVTGARFVNTSGRMLLDYLGVALGSFAVAMAVAATFGLVVTSLLPFPIADVVIAFAPGGQDTMMLLALALRLDPVYVGAHHLARFLVVTLTVAIAARRLARRGPPPREGERWQRPGRGAFED